MRHSRGFTLVESISVAGVIGILTVLGTAVVSKSMRSASMVREVNAAKQLVTGLHNSAQDNNGQYLPGMDYRAGTPSFPVYKPDGSLVTMQPTAHRYPYRLAPYLGNNFSGAIFVNRNKAEIDKYAGPMYDYFVSTFPALGMNIYGVGGVVAANGTILNAADCISRMSQMSGSILAFASGGYGTGASRMHGYCYVTPPTKESGSPISIKWDPASTWTDQKNPMQFGWVDFRYDGKAVCAFLDGSVKQCSVEELSDMRHWTISALNADDPNYEIQ